MERINYVMAEALSTALVGIEEVDAIAVTYGPGLVGGYFCF